MRADDFFMLLVDGVFFNAIAGLFGVFGKVNPAEFGPTALGKSVRIKGIFGLLTLKEFSVLINGALGLDILDESAKETL